MKNFFLALSLFMGLCVPRFYVVGQTLLVKDAKSKEALEFAAVYQQTSNHPSLSDAKGRAALNNFDKTAPFFIQLLGYKTAIINYEEMEAAGFQVFLDPLTISLNEVLISAANWSQERKDVPAKITVLQRKDMLLQNPQTAADLLGTSGEVFIQKSQAGGGSPMMRGFAANRVLMSVDGVRMNNAIFRSGNLQNVISIDPIAVERTEILFGPGAVMYGSDAIGGAMNFYTLTPRLSSEKALRAGGSLISRYSSANEEQTVHADLNLGTRKWAWLSSFSFNDFGDTRTGSRGPDDFLRPDYQTRLNNRDTVLQNPDPRRQINSGYRQWNMMQKIRFVPNEQWDLQIAWHQSESSNIPRYDRLIERNKQGGPYDGEWYYGPQIWQMLNLNITRSGSTFFYDRMRWTVAKQYFQESRHNRTFGSTRRTDRTEKVEAYSFNLDFDKSLGQGARLFYGLEYINNYIRSVGEQEQLLTGAKNPTSTRYPNASSWRSYAAYGNYVHRLSEQFTLQAGLRYSQVRSEAAFSTQYFPFPFTQAEANRGALTGSTGLTYRPGEQWQFNLYLATGFRAPNIDDLGKVFDSEPGSVIVPNPALRPEYAQSIETGLSKIVGEHLKIEFSAYYTNLNNALVRRNFRFNGQDSLVYDGRLSQVTAIQNAAKAYLYGVQAGFEWKLPANLTLLTRLTYQQGEEELDGGDKAPLRHSVPFFGLTRLSYRNKGLTMELNMQFQSSVSFEDLAPSEKAKAFLYAKDEQGQPYSQGWATFNLRAMYQFSSFLMLNVGVDNITDLRYRPYSSGITAPGRNFIFSMRASF